MGVEVLSRAGLDETGGNTAKKEIREEAKLISADKFQTSTGEHAEFCTK